MKNDETLSALSVGEEGKVSFLLCEGAIRRRLLDIGLVPGTLVLCIGKSPLGDPKAYMIRGKTIAIRSDDAKKIAITAI